MALDKAQIEAIIPHRSPILLVDGVQSYTPDEKINASRYFPADDHVFEGHFPGNPLLPGVLMVEALAQAAALLVSLSRSTTAENSYFLFMAVESAKFRRSVVPEETLILEVNQLKRKRDVYRFEGVAKVGDDVAANAIFMAKHVITA